MPDEKPNEQATPSADEKMQAAVTAAVTAGLKTALPEVIKPFADQISGGSIRREAAPVRTAAPVIEDVTPEEFSEAIESGDKARITAAYAKQRRADRARSEAEIQRITAAGGAAFGSVSRMAADKLPYYTGKYKKLIDERVAAFQEEHPGVMITPEHYKAAHDMVVGENIGDISASEREEAIRKSREPDPALTPNGERGRVDDAPKEPEALKEVLSGDWGKEFRVKQRAVGGRSDDEELRKLGFRGGFKDFLTVRKDMDALDEDTGGTFGLDRDWNKKEGKWSDA